MRRSVRLLLLFCLLLLVSACATPIGVTRVDPQEVYRSLTSSVLSTSRPSAATAQVLVRTGLAQRFQDDPEGTLAALRGTGVDLNPYRLLALAELSFLHAEATHQPAYYLAAAVYAYAFLFPTAETGPEPFEPHRSAAAPRGRSLQPRSDPRAVHARAGPRRPRSGPTAPALRHVHPRRRSAAVCLGRVPAEWFHPGGRVHAAWPPQPLSPAWRGCAAGGSAEPAETGPAAAAARKRIPPRLKVPVTAFVRLGHVSESIATGHVVGQLELYPADQATSVAVATQTVPLELEPSATLAYVLEGAPVWRTELGGFLSADRRSFPEGLGMLHPTGADACRSC